MFRTAMHDLIKWKSLKVRKPLIIRGARQVGKTWLMKEFGKNEYKKVAYINFDNNERMNNVFNGDLDIDRIVIALQIEAGEVIEAENTLIIFDEVQEVPRALTSLKYFYENAPQYQVISAGSLLGMGLHPGTSFPVGKVDFLDLYPLDFEEFLNATDHEALADLIRKRDFELVAGFKSKYIELLRQYYYIGGMPEAVSCFVDTKDYRQVREVQIRLLMAYEQDMSKHAPNETIPRIRLLWNSIPAQLAKENSKFIYGLIKKGARAREYELAMQWLLDCGLIHKVQRVNKPNMPLTAYQDFNAFKIFLLDVGLLSAMSGLDLKTLLEGNRVFEEFKGALTEQYVFQQLLTSRDIKPFYWSADQGRAEVDFIFQYKSEVIPLEVKAAENLQAKSLKSFRQKYQPRIALRTSMSNYRNEEWLINIPLYAINSVKDIVGQELNEYC